MAGGCKVIGELFLVARLNLGSVGYSFVFWVKTLELAVLFGACTHHVELPVGGAEEVPAMQVVNIAVAVVVSSVELLIGIAPKRWPK